MLLADLGAEVILLEHPSGKERAERPPGFLSILNRNKKSLTLDLKSQKGKEIFCKLVAKSDVFMEGFRPGAVQRMGIDYRAVEKMNPRIIYCSLSGYGQDSPYRNRPAHNNAYMGIAGMITTLAGFSPSYNRYVPVADLSGAMFAALNIVSALRVRDITGKGQYIDVSITDCSLSWMSGNLGVFFSTGHLRPALPATDFYRTKDDKYISLSVGATDSLWENLCCALGLDELADMSRSEREEKFEELEMTLRELISRRSREEWIELLTSADAPCSPVLALNELESDSHVRHRGLIIEVQSKGEKVRQVAYPVRFSESRIEIRKPAPALGEDTAQLLQDLGYSQDEIDRLRKEKVT
jgi:formyl-CoA transferase/CoA:oxalate CoA-transferase